MRLEIHKSFDSVSVHSEHDFLFSKFWSKESKCVESILSIQPDLGHSGRLSWRKCWEAQQVSFSAFCCN